MEAEVHSETLASISQITRRHTHTSRNSYLYAQLWELEALVAFGISFLLWTLDIGLEIFA